MIALAAMLGQIGRPGTGFGFGHGSMGGMGTPRAEIPSVGMSVPPNPAGSFIPVARVTEMLERPGGEYDFNGRRLRYPDTRLIYWAGGNPFHHHQDLNRLQRAWARAETVVVHEPWWTAVARRADIVLPATTTLERDDIGSAARDRFILAMKQAIPPQGQARDDYAIFADIVGRAGHARALHRAARRGGLAARDLRPRRARRRAMQDVELPEFDAFWAAGHVEVPPPETDLVPLRRHSPATRRRRG